MGSLSGKVKQNLTNILGTEADKILNIDGLLFDGCSVHYVVFNKNCSDMNCVFISVLIDSIAYNQLMEVLKNYKKALRKNIKLKITEKNKKNFLVKNAYFFCNRSSKQTRFEQVSHLFL